MSLNLFDCSRSSQRHPSYLRLNSQPFLILTNRVRQDLERKSLPRVGSSEPSAPVWAVILIGPTSVCTELCNRKTIRSGLQRHRAEVTELCVLNEQRGRARDTQMNRETKAAHTWQRGRWTFRRRHHQHMRERGGKMLTLKAHQRSMIGLVVPIFDTSNGKMCMWVAGCPFGDQPHTCTHICTLRFLLVRCIVEPPNLLHASTNTSCLESAQHLEEVASLNKYVLRLLAGSRK